MNRPHSREKVIKDKTVKVEKRPLNNNVSKANTRGSLVCNLFKTLIKK